MNLKNLHKIICFFSVILTVSTFSQSSKIDSLTKLLTVDVEDTTKVNHLTDLLKLHIRNGEFDKAQTYIRSSLQLASRLNYSKGLALTYMGIGIMNNINSNTDSAFYYFNKASDQASKAGIFKITGDANVWIGLLHYGRSDYMNALENYNKAKECYKKAGHIEGIAMCLGNIGVVYKDQGNFTKALTLYIESLKLAEQINDKRAIILANGNIGVVYYYLRNYDKAVDYYTKALIIAESENDKSNIALQTGNIGIIYSEMSDKNDDPKISDSLSAKALRYYSKALSISEEIHETKKIPNIHINMANLHAKRNRFSEAAKHYEMALKIATENGFKHEIAGIKENTGGFLMLQGKYKEAEVFLLEAAKLHHETGSINSERTTHNQLSKLYEHLKRFELSLFHHKKEMALKDSIFNIEKNKEITQKELSYKFEKKQSEEKAIHDKEISVAEADKKRQKGIIVFISIVLVLVVVFLVYVFNTLKIRNKQKKVIEMQKMVVEEKQKEILDSINYAKRIQRSLLANEELLNKYLPDHFVFFKPKDIVSGDFYWAAMENDKFYLAICDSTGHGVPGAFMSLLNIGFLNEAIKEKHLTSPDKIFDHTRARLIESISKDGQKDGFDGILVCFDIKSKKISYAAANNAPVLLSNGKLIQLSADKMPVGMGERKQDFSVFTIDFEPGSMLYLYTDGYPDQFGGPKGKKFMYKKLNELLLVNASRSLEDQRQALIDTFEAWSGDLEQVDDVCVVGIRL